MAESSRIAGELAGIRLIDIADERLTVNQSVWHGKVQDPKTDNAVRTLALSPQLITLLWEQIARQKAKQHEFLFSASTGAPWDMNVFRRRKMRILLKSLGFGRQVSTPSDTSTSRCFGAALVCVSRVETTARLHFASTILAWCEWCTEKLSFAFARGLPSNAPYKS
jgi:hypothetical protein